MSDPCYFYYLNSATNFNLPVYTRLIIFFTSQPDSKYPPFALTLQNIQKFLNSNFQYSVLKYSTNRYLSKYLQPAYKRPPTALTLQCQICGAPAPDHLHFGGIIILGFFGHRAFLILFFASFNHVH